jgi:photosystem II stability/assembly factor-like uncharacterized protein
MIPPLLARAWPLLALAACSSAQPPQPLPASVAAPPVVAAPAREEAAPPSESAPEEPVAPPPASASAPAAALVLDPAPPGAWAGKQGNVPKPITGLWGASGHVFAVGGGLILHSEDGGLRWASAPGPMNSPDIWGSSIDDIYIGGSEVVRSTDNGKTFVPTGPLPRGGNAFGVWGRGPDEVYAVGGGAGKPFIARTEDHGRTWVEIPHDIQDGWFYGVTGAGPREVIVSGKEQRGKTSSGQPLGYVVLLRSTDGGKTWKRLPPPPRGSTDFEHSRKLCHTRSGTLFVAASYDVYSTRDLGKTWRLAVSVGTEILGMTCAGDEVFVGGRNRAYFHSRDEGKTWDGNELDAVWTSPALSSVQAFFVADTGEAYVGGEGTYDRSVTGTLLRRSR